MSPKLVVFNAGDLRSGLIDVDDFHQVMDSLKKHKQIKSTADMVSYLQDPTDVAVCMTHDPGVLPELRKQAEASLLPVQELTLAGLSDLLNKGLSPEKVIERLGL